MHLLQTLMGRGDSIAQNMQESLNEHKVPSLYFTLATTLEVFRKAPRWLGFGGIHCWSSSRSFTDLVYIKVINYLQRKKSRRFKPGALAGHDTGSPFLSTFVRTFPVSAL